MILLKRNYFAVFMLLMIPVIGLSAALDELIPKVDIITVKDFSRLAETAKNQQKLIMLEVSASYCSYCLKLEEEIIKPMLRSGDYDADVLIRKVDIDSINRIRDFAGQSISSSSLAHLYDIEVTPTIIFLNSQNQEVSKRIVGVNSLDYFSSYVDDAIKHGLTVIR